VHERADVYQQNKWSDVSETGEIPVFFLNIWKSHLMSVNRVIRERKCALLNKAIRMCTECDIWWKQGYMLCSNLASNVNTLV